MQSTQPKQLRLVHEHGEHVIYASFPNALCVYLVGEFNHWSTTATPMSLQSDGWWRAALQVDAPLRSHCFFVWDEGYPWPRLVRPDDAEQDEPNTGRRRHSFSRGTKGPTCRR